MIYKIHYCQNVNCFLSIIFRNIERVIGWSVAESWEPVFLYAFTPGIEVQYGFHDLQFTNNPARFSVSQSIHGMCLSYYHMTLSKWTELDFS